MSTDAVEYEAKERSPVTLLSGGRVTGSGSGDEHAFENVSRVFLRAMATKRNTRRQGAATLTVTVEDSADGSSWATIATFSFTDTETQTETVDSPREFLRVAWSVGSGAWGLAADAVLFESAAAGGGGGSLPAQWTVGPDGELTITTTNETGDDVLVIQAPVGYHLGAGSGLLIRLMAGDGTQVFDIDPSGAINVTPSPEEGTPAQLVLQGYQDGENTSIKAGSSSGAVDRITVGRNGAVVFKVSGTGVISTLAHAAPADNTMFAGEMALWFDQTNGAAKLKVKAKTADGTVVVGELALT